MVHDPDRRARLLVLCLSLLAYGYFVYRGPHHNPDSRLALTYSLVERRALDIDPYAATTLDRAFAGGHYYTDKAPGVSFALAPLYAGLRFILPPSLVDVGAPGQPDRFVVRYLLTFLGIGVPAALFNTALFSWLGHIEPRVSPRLAVALGYALGSPAYPFAVSAFGHVPAALALGSALMLLWPKAAHGRPLLSAVRRPPPFTPRLVGAGLLLGLAVTLEYPAALGSLALGALAIWQAVNRRATFGALAAGAAAPLLLLGSYHWAVFGSPLSVGYGHLAPGTEYVAIQSGGLLGIHWPDARVGAELLAGTHRGLLVFAPWLILAAPGAVLLWRRERSSRCLGNWRPMALVAAATFGALLLVNSGYALWDGGASWGPRHLVPALPLLVVLSLPAAARWPRLAWALVVASIAVTLAGVATGSLPDSEVRSPLADLVWPRVLAGGVTNNWGQVAGLSGWRGLVPMAGLATLLVVWGCGWRRAAGALVVAGWSLAAIALLDRNYLEYSEGYYLYLGSRLAAGARLYAQTASTQPPLLPLVISLLWRIQPDVWLPRLLAIGCYALTAVLAGRLAARLTAAPWAAPTATALAALLPLGAGAPQVLDANAVLAPLAIGLALLWARAAAAERHGGHPSLAAGLAGALAALGLATKLTFAPFALAPLLAAVARRRVAQPVVVYTLALGACLGAQAVYWGAVAGASAADALFGELESPVHVAGALLALFQFSYLEGIPVALAALGWRRVRLGQHEDSSLWFGVAAASLPLFAIHQGTFVGVVRPAEPFVAAFAAAGLSACRQWLAQRPGTALAGRTACPERGEKTKQEARIGIPHVVVGVTGLAAVLMPGIWSAEKLFPAHTVDADRVLAPLQAVAAPDQPLLAPPYYAALAGRTMLFDYADWTVWGMRSAGGATRERELTAEVVDRLHRRQFPVIAADFRLAYISPLAEALARDYRAAGTDGDDAARAVTLWVPR